ncbi:nudix hydrolase 3-like isoform X1 [Mercurialis annua]|uniref:nudix hydrolase 3-like isoform X1 n=1 Tax=Mercurialis annua TaxID=3986 RepID=UPI002160B2FC|nr:nudix hydrolase 3-like isoform X1 [Mercurialis annua]
MLSLKLERKAAFRKPRQAPQLFNDNLFLFQYNHGADCEWFGAEVHRNGDYHRVWIYAESTQEVLMEGAPGRARLFVFLQECIINVGNYINNEYNDVYLVTTVHPIPLKAFTLQETEVSAVKYVSFEAYVLKNIQTMSHMM